MTTAHLNSCKQGSTTGRLARPAVSPTLWSATARRLFVAFGAVVLVFALASGSLLARLSRLDDGLSRMQEHEEGVRLSLELASAVRDQYAHQAHTIILGNATHVGFYDTAATHVRQLTRAMAAHTADAEERAFVADIEHGSRELDAIFHQRIVPAVLRSDRTEIDAEHARAQSIVSLIQLRTDALAGRLEQRIQVVRRQAQAAERAARRWTIFFAVAAPLLAAVVGLYIGRSVARPLSLLREGAARLARGERSTRIELDTADEFGALARQFNAMTEALHAHEGKLVESEKLASVGRLAAGVAHEINNPLAVILGYTRLLRKGAAPALNEDLKIIEDETLRCLEIVEGLLDLTRPARPSAGEVDLGALAREVCGRLLDATRLDGVAVSVEGEARVRGHAPKLRQLVWNLVKNAAEAAGPGGRLTLELAQIEDGGAELRISDSGPGIDPKIRGRLFEPFATSKANGMGLGLAVSRAIARAHGGDIEVSAGPLGGACFCVRLRAPAETEAST